MMHTTQVYLLHNPNAGDQDSGKDDLIRAIESQGFTCRYASVKKSGWKRFGSATELVVVAGGDGTVRKVVKELLNRKMTDEPITLALLPNGTANNFAKALGVSSNINEFRQYVAAWQPRKVDIGAARVLQKSDFFLEGLGCGLIPELIKKMENTDLTLVNSTVGEIHLALQTLLEIVDNYQAKYAKIIIDGVLYEGDYILVEVLNTRSIGPNFILAPNAAATDKKFEVVLLQESDRPLLKDYIQALQRYPGNPPVKVPWKVYTAKEEIQFHSGFSRVHVDDELITIKKGSDIHIEIRPGVLDILT